MIQTQIRFRLYNHDKYHTVNGTIYYDGSDLGLSNLAIYNGNHLAITTDGTRP